MDTFLRNKIMELFKHIGKLQPGHCRVKYWTTNLIADDWNNDSMTCTVTAVRLQLYVMLGMLSKIVKLQPG